ncbi:MAG TPA: HAD hydrolase family protein [Flavitalea sp.]|nr:HAD hydrolase family protein [Flavitalea sp.]
MTLLEKFSRIKVFAFDVDGVLTDGNLYLAENGEQLRRMNIKDGFALQLAIKKGYRIVIISGSYSEPSISRLSKLGIADIYMRITDKAACLQNYLAENNLVMSDVLFMGDDIPDYPVMTKVGIAACPKDAAGEIRNCSQYISRFNGGEGCVRDVIEKVLKLNQHWELQTNIPSR